MMQAQGFSFLIDWVYARILECALHPTANIKTLVSLREKTFFFFQKLKTFSTPKISLSSSLSPRALYYLDNTFHLIKCGCALSFN